MKINKDHKQQIEKELRLFKRRTGSYIIVTNEIAKYLDAIKIDPLTYRITKFI